ncbi:MAG: LamG-like jellyroll fold domain-containing protein, partial [Verrucomicrobiota bacterium]
KNSPSLVSGVRSNCFLFNGNTHYVTRTHGFSPESDGLPVYWAPTGYTVAFWVRGAPQAASRGIFVMGNSTNISSTLRIATDKTANGNKLSVYVKDVTGAFLINQTNSASVVLDNTWHHIAWVDNKGVATLYVDGVPDSSNFNYTFPADLASMPLNITRFGSIVGASGAGGNLFSGSIDEAEVWERPLNQLEVQEVMSSGLATPIPASLPTIVQPPVEAVRYVGDRATFSVAAFGRHPLAYQWYENGIALTGQTNTTLILTNLTAVGTNAVSITVSNFLGCVTNTVQLAVLPALTVNLGNGLVSYWPLDVVTNLPPTTPDVYRGNDMALISMDSSNLTSGPFNQALTFNGSSQYLNRTHGFSREIGGLPVYTAPGGYSVAMWLKGAPQAANRLLFAMGNSTNNNPSVWIATDRYASGNKLCIYIKTVTGAALLSLRDTASTVLDNRWHHIAWVDNKGDATFYVDGTPDSANFAYTAPSPELMPLDLTRIGATARSTPGNYFSGAIDEVAVWERPLNQAEVHQIMMASVPLHTELTIVQALADALRPVGGHASFLVAAVGQEPLSYQWWKDGVALTGQTNTT